MSLTNKTFVEMLQVQVKFKLHAYLGMVTYLIILQVVGMLLSLVSSSTMSLGSDIVDVNFSIFRTTMVLVLSCFWSFYIGMLMMRHDQRADIMPFVTTRTMSSASDSIVLAIIAIFAGITTMLSNYVVRIIVMLKSNQNIIAMEDVFNAPGIFLKNIAAFIVVILCVASVGYFFGMIMQKSKLVMCIISASCFSMLFTELGQEILLSIRQLGMHPILYFAVNLLTSAILFILSAMMANNLEVRG
ncbi:hypothetical protein ACQKMD_17375 [Viridibacillus sp. NPDC096237]|uniref:hypothetical protein n=1 Tax=Viridibacillus sp. NPDC096237 TaxID=3390721 RepID=UPI003D03861E